MRIAVTILDQKGRGPRHPASNRQNATNRVIKRENSFHWLSELELKGGRGLDAPYSGPRTRLRTIFYWLQHID